MTEKESLESQEGDRSKVSRGDTSCSLKTEEEKTKTGWRQVCLQAWGPRAGGQEARVSTGRGRG